MKLDPVNNELPQETPEIRNISTSMISMHPWLESHECYAIKHLGPARRERGCDGCARTPCPPAPLISDLKQSEVGVLFYSNLL